MDLEGHLQHAGLLKKSSLEVEGLLSTTEPYRPARSSVLGSGERGGGDVTGGLSTGWRSIRTALGDFGVDHGPNGNNSQLTRSLSRDLWGFSLSWVVGRLTGAYL